MTFKGLQSSVKTQRTDTTIFEHCTWQFAILYFANTKVKFEHKIAVAGCKTPQSWPERCNEDISANKKEFPTFSTPSSPCSHSGHTQQSSPLPICSWAHGRCSWSQNWCHGSKNCGHDPCTKFLVKSPGCSASSRDFHSLASSILQSGWDLQSFPENCFKWFICKVWQN